MPTGRLAPSPTGLLHLGHARSFLLAWWQARAARGRVVMRIEDLDPERSRPAFADAALGDLEWLGLDWDGPVIRQSERRPAHDEALERLERTGRAYACVCTRAEVAAATSAPHADEPAGVYPGTCRGRFADRSAARAESGREPGLRARVEPGTTIAFEDGVHGAVVEAVDREVGDFLVMRRDGVPAYQLAVVVDDALDGVDLVLRGDDLLASTARQKLLQTWLGLPHPAWCHVPLVVDGGGRRLAKRTDALSLRALRAAGVDPRAIVGWVAQSAGQDVPERASANDVVASFALERLPREPVVVSNDALPFG